MWLFPGERPARDGRAGVERSPRVPAMDGRHRTIDTRSQLAGEQTCPMSSDQETRLLSHPLNSFPTSGCLSA